MASEIAHQENPGAGISLLVDRLRGGDTRALARAISLVENDAPEARALLSACFPHTGSALRIGITGSPGAGKSTLVDRLARGFRASRTGGGAGKTVGVLAVDPTSPFTGGAILGDRIRFQERSSEVGVAGRIGDAGFYARSMATRGALGGIALATADAGLVLEASGKDIILIETVGVGQDEIEIARLADITLLVLVPGMGDDVQSLKAGVMEIADLYVINKSDREGADRVEQEIRALQSLAPPSRGRGEAVDDGAAPEGDWTPPVVRTVATTGEGIDRLASGIAAMELWLHEKDRLTTRRARHWQRRLDAMLRTELMRRARQNGVNRAQLSALAAEVAAGRQDPWSVIPKLAEQLFSATTDAERESIP